jgi:hypothetical protein
MSDKPVEKIEDIFESVQPDQPAAPVGGFSAQETAGTGQNAEPAQIGKRGISKGLVSLIAVLLVVAGVAGAYFFVPEFKSAVSRETLGAWNKGASLLSSLTGGGQASSEEASCPDDKFTCPDGTVLVRKGNGCQFPACPDAKSLGDGAGSAVANHEFAKIADSGNQEFFRDSKRLSDIGRAKDALEKFRVRTGTYPRNLEFGQNLTALDGGVIAHIPRNPLPGGEEYDYRSYAKDGYIIVFTLESGAEGVGKGKSVALPEGNSPAADSDGDGLFDAEERMYGTDPKTKDTDKDGYSDMEELSKGYNPAGTGMYGRR